MFKVFSQMSNLDPCFESNTSVVLAVSNDNLATGLGTEAITVVVARSFTATSFTATHPLGSRRGSEVIFSVERNFTGSGGTKDSTEDRDFDLVKFEAMVVTISKLIQQMT